MINYELSLYGFTFTGIAEIEPEELPDEDYPGHSTIVTILSIYINGGKDDAFTIICPSVVALLESMLKEEHEG